MRASLASAITLVALGLAAFAPTAQAGTIVPGIFELFNHPNGNISDSHGPYGLRLDFLPPPGAGPTFSVEADADPVLLTWNIDSTAIIEGRVVNNETGEFWLVEYHLTGLTTYADGFEAAAGSGMLTYDDVGPPQADIPLTGKLKNGSVFNFFADGHRLDDDDMSTVGRGWLDEDGHANDWLVTATQVEEFEIPEPASFVLLLFGMTSLCGLRRHS